MADIREKAAESAVADWRNKLAAGQKVEPPKDKYGEHIGDDVDLLRGGGSSEDTYLHRSGEAFPFMQDMAGWTPTDPGVEQAYTYPQTEEAWQDALDAYGSYAFTVDQDRPTRTYDSAHDYQAPSTARLRAASDAMKEHGYADNDVPGRDEAHDLAAVMDVVSQRPDEGSLYRPRGDQEALRQQVVWDLKNLPKTIHFWRDQPEHRKQFEFRLELARRMADKLGLVSGPEAR